MEKLAMILLVLCCNNLIGTIMADVILNSTELKEALNTINTDGTLVSISNEILPDIGSYSTFWDNYEPPIDIQKNYPYYHAGYDYDHHPIWIEEMGRWNMRKSVEVGGETFKHFDRHCVQSMYRMIQSVNQSSTPDNPVTGIFYIIDFDGFSLEQMTHVPTLSYMISLMRKYLGLIQENLHMGIIVNTNAVAHTLVNIMRPVLGRVFEKVEVYGTNKAKFIPQILKHVPKDQIPVWYGGTKDFQPIKVYG